MKSFAELADHEHAEFALAIQDFAHPASRAEKRYQIRARGKSRRVQPKRLKRLGLILTALTAATQVGQMAMPGLRYHPLKGGRHSVWVDENYRVTFSFQRGHAYEVDYEDYH